MQDAASTTDLARTASSVGRLFAQRARIDPDAVALWEGGKSRSFGTLDARVNRLANVLSEIGVSCGDRVALLSRNRMEYVEVELAAGKIGAITACQNWRLADPELTHCLDLSMQSVMSWSVDVRCTAFHTSRLARTIWSPLRRL